MFAECVHNSQYNLLIVAVNLLEITKAILESLNIFKSFLPLGATTYIPVLSSIAKANSDSFASRAFISAIALSCEALLKAPFAATVSYG